MPENIPKPNSRDTKTKERYVESTATKNFLASQHGIPFLLTRFDEAHETHGQTKDVSLYDRIDNLIDFYTTWTNSFPVRKNLKVTKYEYLKHVEEFCQKNDIYDEFYPLLAKDME